MDARHKNRVLMPTTHPPSLNTKVPTPKLSSNNRNEVQEKQTYDAEAVLAVEAPKPEVQTVEGVEFRCGLMKCATRVSSKEALQLHMKEEHGTDVSLDSICHLCGIIYASGLKIHLKKVHNVEYKYGYRCDVCSAILSCLSSHRKHLRRHEPKKKCNFCGKQFRSSYLSSHIANKHKKREVSCEWCDHKCATKTLLRKHVQAHHRETPPSKVHTCDSCDQSFQLKSQLTEHEKQVHDKSFICEICQKIFKNQNGFYNHKKSHEPDFSKSMCEKCGATFNSNSYLRTHMRKTHSDAGSKKKLCKICNKYLSVSGYRAHMIVHTGRRNYCCERCGKRFFTTTSLHIHQRTHFTDKQFRCNICDKRFTQSHSLKTHLMSSHTGERPYQCDICSKAFVTKQSLRNHKPTHLKKRPRSTPSSYKCSFCDKTFTSKLALAIHQKGHAEFKPYKCDVCGKAFTKLATLNYHKIVHTGEKPFKCDSCDTTFIRENSLKLHQKIHTGERPYQCDVCGKTFPLQSYLNQHKRLHWDEKPYVCEICQKRFLHSGALQAHYTVHSAERPFECQLCQKRFKIKRSLMKHYQLHEGQGRLKCKVCGCRFHSREEKDEHQCVLIQELSV